MFHNIYEKLTRIDLQETIIDKATGFSFVKQGAVLFRDTKRIEGYGK